MPNAQGTDYIDPFSERPTYAEIDLDALGRNLDCIKELVSPSQVIAVVKANAYGHGLVRSGLYLEKAGVHSLAVAYI